MGSKRECTDPDSGVMLAAYEMGLLVSDDRQRFEQHLSRCEACREQMFAMAPNIITMQANATESAHTLASQLRSSAMAHASMDDMDKALRREAEHSRRRTNDEESATGRGWGDWFKALVERIRPAHGHAFRWATAVPVAMTALLLVAITLQQAFKGPDWSSQAILAPVVYVPQSTRAGLTDNAHLKMIAGMDAYVRGSYAEAAQPLVEAADLLAAELVAGQDLRDSAEFTVLASTRDQAQFFAGLSFLLAGKAPDARPHLEAAASSSVRVVADRAHWYLAQLHLLQNRPDDARDLLTKLAAASPGYQVQAAEQLEALATP